MIAFDIETGPLPDEEILKQVKPFEAPKHPGTFDPDRVKTGNLKDPAKIKAKLQDAYTAHERACSEYETNVEILKREWWASTVGSAALSPLTGRILAIGYLSTDTDALALDIGDEEPMLRRFWKQYEKCKSEGRLLVGHNITAFDVPFIIRRSWIHGMSIPAGVIERNRIDHKVFVDTMHTWSCGNREMISLDSLCRAFGVQGKPEGVDGSMFADLLKADREKAEYYLTNDLNMTVRVAEQMGIV